MNHSLYIVLTFTLLLTGCGKKMTGLYEAVPDIPEMRIPGLDANTKRQMDAQFRQIQNMSRMTLQFEGSKVRMGTASAISEYSYRIDGNKLEVIAEGMGQKMIMPMIIEGDGSITYQTLRFYRKK